MRIQVETLPPRGETFALELTGAELLESWGHPPELSGWRFERAAAKVRLQPSHGGIELGGTVDVAFAAPCRFCLVPVERALQEEAAVRFEPNLHEPPLEEEHEITEGEFHILPYDGETIDLGAWLAEQISLVIPDFQDCSYGDPETCPNREQAPAPRTDDRETIDPRWAVLKEIQTEGEEGGA